MTARIVDDKWQQLADAGFLADGSEAPKTVEKLAELVRGSISRQWSKRMLSFFGLARDHLPPTPGGPWLNRRSLRLGWPALVESAVGRVFNIGSG